MSYTIYKNRKIVIQNLYLLLIKQPKNKIIEYLHIKQKAPVQVQFKKIGYFLRRSCFFMMSKRLLLVTSVSSDRFLVFWFSLFCCS